MCTFPFISKVRYSKGILYVGQGITSHNVMIRFSGGALYEASGIARGNL